MRSASRWDAEERDRSSGGGNRREQRDYDRGGYDRVRERSRSPYRKRDRRSRSRSHERDRDRGSRRRRSRSSSRSREYSATSADRYRRSPRSRSPPFSNSMSRNANEASGISAEQANQPHYKVAITVLPPHFERDELSEFIARQGFSPTDIRVVRKPHQGGTKVFGFVDFATVEEAQQWMDYNKGHFELEDGFRARMDYARENQYAASVLQQADLRKRGGDWMCAKCTINNFNKRTNCFKCGTSREASEEMDRKGCGMIGTNPCDTLVVRELPTGCSEDSLMHDLSQYTTIAILRVCLAESRRYAFLQLRSVEEASYVLSTFTIAAPIIGNCAVIVNYSRQSLNRILLAESVSNMKQQTRVSASTIAQDGVNAAAQLAQNALQIAQMGRSSNADQYGNVPTVPTPFGTFPQYAACPQKSSFHFDPNTGYYYDAITGLYFDSNSEYFFNPQQQIWMFWSVKYMTFIPCEGGEPELKRQLHEESRASLGAFPSGQQQNPQHHDLAAIPTPEEAAASAPQSTEVPFEDNEKPKTAADIQKEMAKWSKRQEKVKISFSKPTTASASNQGGSPKEKGSKGKPWQDDSDEEVDEPLPARKNNGLPAKPKANGAPAVASPAPSKTDSFNEAEFINYEKKSCLLCRRAFNSVEILEKHVQQSDLHKKNLTAKRAELAPPSPSAPQTFSSSAPSSMLKAEPFRLDSFAMPVSKMQYRDRAKERRQQFGLDPGFQQEEMAAEPAMDSASAEAHAAAKAATPLDESNIGSRLLKKHGWTEGQGVGKNNQGIVNPIQVERRVQGAGLGVAGSKMYGSSTLSRKEQMRVAMINRFNNT